MPRTSPQYVESLLASGLASSAARRFVVGKGQNPEISKRKKERGGTKNQYKLVVAFRLPMQSKWS